MTAFVPYRSNVNYALQLGAEWGQFLKSTQAVFTPTNWQADGTEPMMLFGMGSGSNWETIFNSDIMMPIIRTVLAQGGGIAVGVFGGDGFANPGTQSQMTTLADKVVNKFNCHPKLLTGGFSMGALNALAWAGNNPERVRGIWATGPLVDLSTFDGVDVLESAYPPDGWTPDMRPTTDPFHMADAGRYVGMDIRIAYSGDDPVVSPQSVRDFGLKVNKDTVNLGNIGHDWTIPNHPTALRMLGDLVRKFR